MPQPRYHINKLWLEAGGQYYAYSVCLSKADVLELSGEWQQAEELFRKNLEFAKLAGAQSQTADSQIKLFRIMRYMGKVHDPLASLDEALTIYTELGDQPGISQTINNLGLVHAAQGRHQKAEECFNDLIARSKRFGDSKHLISGLGNLSQVHMNRGRFDQALECLEQCAEASLRENDSLFLSITYGTMGNVYFFQDRLDRSYEYYKKQLDLARRLGDPANQSIAVGNIGNINYRQGKYREAVDCYRTKLEISQKLDYKAGISQSCGNLGIVHAEQEQYQTALEYFERQLSISEEAGDPEGREGGCCGLGTVYAKTGEYGRSREYFLKAVEIDLEAGFDRELDSNYLQLAEVCSKAGDKTGALDHLEKAKLSAQKNKSEDILAKAEILEIKIAAGNDLPRTEKMLLEILNKQPGNILEALVYYELCGITGDKEQKTRAIALLQELYDQTLDHDYKRMKTELERTKDDRQG
ncbi:MAG: tetratricopeptide repeat protein [Deltaproteobacteria bacterium]|nr:tetratricopeptide repeat protein [Deltaproteobacteria bacterium]